ncbi:hypothetical protein DQ04_12541020 [Trypanosoma grayi]|uniref:hypothetical protein n=1 Tax=Trypanosoma grayi TaxID=71804 RepID=UPI0004F4BC83|nr:hypothetical protein DQ04_12541020 [Trypanosoma grayi]KEG06729.1 hypothetical protein DQ04_12541020 [Trypanosoma grayi]
MSLDHLKRLRRSMERWTQFVKSQRETRHSLILVETLSSVLVNEAALRAGMYFKWYRFALFDAKLLRLEEEKTTMQREWVIVQNAVDRGNLCLSFVVRLRNWRWRLLSWRLSGTRWRARMRLFTPIWSTCMCRSRLTVSSPSTVTRPKLLGEPAALALCSATGARTTQAVTAC